jgi:hypothetical protein
VAHGGARPGVHLTHRLSLGDSVADASAPCLCVASGYATTSSSHRTLARSSSGADSGP